MSFIDSFLNDLLIWTRVRKMEFSVDNLRSLLKGDSSLLVAGGFVHVKGKINKDVGSTLLRKYVKAVEDGYGLFSDADLPKILAEVNFLLKDFNSSNAKPHFSGSFDAGSSKLDASLAKNIANKGNKSMKSNGLEINAQVWAQTVFHYVQLNGNSDVKRSIRSADDVLKYLELEGGLNKDGTVKVTVTNEFGYCGPFQFGPAAWATGPANFSKFKWSNDSISWKTKPPTLSADRRDMMAKTKAYALQGPGDLDVMGPGVVAFWNKCWEEFLGNNKNSKQRQRYPHAAALSKFVPRSWQMLYAMHNAGSTGAYVRLLGQRVNPVSSAQSVAAQQVGKQALAQFNAQA